MLVPALGSGLDDLCSTRDIASMSLASSDTDAATLAVMTELYARMTPAEKLERVRDLTLTSARLALAGLRARHPQEDEGELLLRLASLRLGDELVSRVYSRSCERDGA